MTPEMVRPAGGYTGLVGVQPFVYLNDSGGRHVRPVPSQDEWAVGPSCIVVCVCVCVF